MEKWVEIWHPEIDGTALVTETSFRKLREPKGWNIVEDEPWENTGPVDDVVEVSVEIEVESEPKPKPKKTKLPE